MTFAAALFACAAGTAALSPDGAAPATPANEVSPSPAAVPFTAIPDDHLHNVHRVTDKVISGAAPEGEASFEKLRSLGVKTIISVDGARPDVQTARRFGLRYVHLPVGYDDVTREEGLAIARAIDELDGPVYVHCHHGRHRSAAAVAVACVMNGRLEPGQAESVLKTFGTGANYKGLWASARSARPLDKAQLAAAKVDYVETAKIPPMADAMVKIDQTWDRLKLAQKAGWGRPPEHPDVDPAHEALQLTEHYHELGRSGEVRAGRPASFREALGRSEREAMALHEALKAPPTTGGAPNAAADAAFRAAGASCTSCHRGHRD